MDFDDVVESLAERAGVAHAAEAMELSVGSAGLIDTAVELLSDASGGADAAWYADVMIETVGPSATAAIAGTALRSALGRGASRWLAEQTGKKLRTAQRWMSADCPKSRIDELLTHAVEAAPDALIEAAADVAGEQIVEAAVEAAPDELRAIAAEEAGAEGLTAARLTRATVVDVGTVAVAYDGKPQGTRHIGAVQVAAGSPRRYLDQCVEDLREGDTEYAATAFGSAVLSGYGTGLERTLEITEYQSAVGLTE